MVDAIEVAAPNKRSCAIETIDSSINVDKTDNCEQLVQQAQLELQAADEAKEGLKKVKTDLELRESTKAEETKSWMQAKTGPSGRRIAEITTEAATATNGDFEMKHTRNSVHMVVKRKGTAVCAVNTTVAKCLTGGGGKNEGSATYPEPLSAEKMLMNKTP